MTQAQQRNKKTDMNALSHSIVGNISLNLLVSTFVQVLNVWFVVLCISEGTAWDSPYFMSSLFAPVMSFITECHSELATAKRHKDNRSMTNRTHSTEIHFVDL